MPSSTAVVERETRLASVETDGRRRNLIFTAVLLGMLLAALDQTIVATALPTVVAELGSPGRQSWVVTSYLLTETIVTVVVGKLGDLYGRKRVFQASVACFVVSSVFCGLAGSMTALVAWRAVQGVGAGGLLVTSMALIAEVIPLRDRARYQGILSSMFSVTSVVGPVIGGLFTDYLSWRWAFWVNLPVGAAVLVVAATAIPALAKAARPVIDYWGILLVGLGVTGLTLATTWGGSTYPWGSPTIVGLFAGSAAALVLFVWVEARTAQPVLPPRLFRDPVFSVCCALAFTVGFAMLGTLTFMPTFMQFVDGAEPTTSGLRTLPMVLGMVFTSTAVGSFVGRTGRYKVFPVAGMAVMTVAFLALSKMDGTSPHRIYYQSAILLVLGVGIGLSMQVLTVVVQNTVQFADLGSATSGVTFFRTIGSSFGAAVFGTLFHAFLSARTPAALAASGAPAEAAESPRILHQLPVEQARPIVAAYAQSLDLVFLCAAPVAVLGFLLALLLKEKPLVQSNSPAVEFGEGFGVPSGSTPEKQLEVAVSWQLRNTHGVRMRHLAQTPGIGLGVAGVWGLLRLSRAIQVFGRATLSGIAGKHQLPPEVLVPVFDALVASGDVVRAGDELSFTPAGAAKAELLVKRQGEFLMAKLAECTGYEARADRDQVDAALRSIARRWLIEEADWKPEADEPALAGSR
ncbi:MDR family MFS transporter [Segniliparus rugosus]|uniref:Drug:H+ antiporter-2 (14 Spanner) (DHA2) family drug resistance MFS transporter n=1 Tax=Segniliparus rugosus (strain ATCC BAA-974 / DSM 45345 / CCUG 50838 / CIP 108380 / JCM 13579 / CDC 945) TaxID=679197 RepID=E5XRE1_SEGRC|nr:MDR family MFS transporter [Segniliparus rugosus]EFV13074.1 drug:H+ antiporter-2 (14 Spanner) (DHA2) family drug resistance MFS transporter [Segniliparus rugosus ATCC BAA-974]